MYSIVLTLHSLIRWLVLLAGLLAAARAIFGWLSNADWISFDNRLGLAFTIGLDVQTLFGLLLYLFLSPITKQAFADFGAAMGDASLRFFALEHIFYMIIALALAHVGRSLSKGAADVRRKHRSAAILFTLSMALILIAIPWDRLG